MKSEQLCIRVLTNVGGQYGQYTNRPLYALADQYTGEVITLNYRRPWPVMYRLPIVPFLP